jgi:hypothetical protein
MYFDAVSESQVGGLFRNDNITILQIKQLQRQHETVGNFWDSLS